LQGRKISDEQIKEWLLELVEGEEHIYGYKLLAECLRNKYELILDIRLPQLVETGEDACFLGTPYTKKQRCACTGRSLFFCSVQTRRFLII
ncbi:hypothetical protein, partial [Paenibacillus cisolokensis]|uniref:hypothetical protein n=1 Tax=Paenibacillus cisolokensis TaxID=1658519 RepID=UPI001BCF68C6